MESIRNVKEALTERSRTASLDELRSRGRKQVKVIRAEHIAAMIEESVQRAIHDSGLIPKEEADALTARSREEFSHLVAERQREAVDSQGLREELGRVKTELADARHAVKAETELAQQLDAAQVRVAELEAEVGSLQEELETARQAPASSAELSPMLIQMVQEIERLKAQGAAPAPQAAAGAAPVPDLAAQMSAAMDGLTRSMDERLDKIGKKMGISSAVDAGQVNLEGIFRDMDDSQVESNLDDMEVKAKKGGGIGANLARLRQLKGGGDAN